ncbi:MAG TPA: catalase family protein [Actinomycetota bacterium]
MQLRRPLPGRMLVASLGLGGIAAIVAAAFWALLVVFLILALRRVNRLLEATTALVETNTGKLGKLLDEAAATAASAQTDLAVLGRALDSVRGIAGTAARVTSLIERVVFWPLALLLGMARALSRFARFGRHVLAAVAPSRTSRFRHGADVAGGPRVEDDSGGQEGAISPEGLLTFLVIRPASDLFLWLWRLERRLEFLYRPQFDRWARPPLFAVLQAFQNALRRDEHLQLAEERMLPEEEHYTRAIIDELKKFTRENWLPGSAQRFGNTKTLGIVRGEFTVLPDIPGHLAQGVFAEQRTYPAWVRFSGPGPYAPPDLEDLGQCSVAIKVMGVQGPKLMEDEVATQDLILVSPASFVTPDIRENAELQRWVRAKAPLGYFFNPFRPHVLHALMQLLYSPMLTSPLEVQYYSNVPFLLGEGQAVQYSLRPRSTVRSKIPVRPSENYLREAMARTLRAGDWTFDFMVQVQTDPHRMPIENATVKWPEHLSPYVPVAHLRLPAQRFDSDAQLAFADVLRYNPWHSLPAHKPLGNSNRARRQMYWELAELRQAMNRVQHVEPTGDETFEE